MYLHNNVLLIRSHGFFQGLSIVNPIAILIHIFSSLTAVFIPFNKLHPYEDSRNECVSRGFVFLPTGVYRNPQDVGRLILALAKRPVARGCPSCGFLQGHFNIKHLGSQMRTACRFAAAGHTHDLDFTSHVRSMSLTLKIALYGERAVMCLCQNSKDEPNQRLLLGTGGLQN